MKFTPLQHPPDLPKDLGRLAGLPIHRRYVKVNLGADGLPTMVVSDYAPHLQNIAGLNTTPAFSAAKAQSMAHELMAPSRAHSSKQNWWPTLLIPRIDVAHGGMGG